VFCTFFAVFGRIFADSGQLIHRISQKTGFFGLNRRVASMLAPAGSAKTPAKQDLF
jgi:hypothetical protein